MLVKPSVLFKLQELHKSDEFWLAGVAARVSKLVRFRSQELHGKGVTGVVALPQARPELRKPARSVPQSVNHDMANF